MGAPIHGVWSWILGTTITQCRSRDNSPFGVCLWEFTRTRLICSYPVCLFLPRKHKGVPSRYVFALGRAAGMSKRCNVMLLSPTDTKLPCHLYCSIDLGLTSLSVDGLLKRVFQKLEYLVGPVTMQELSESHLARNKYHEYDFHFGNRPSGLKVRGNSRLWSPV